MSQLFLICGAAAASVGLYGIVIFQLRKRFPERAAGYVFELSLVAIVTLAGGAIKGINAIVLAGGPAIMFTLCLIAGKGSIAALVYDPRFGDVRTETSRKSQRRLVALLITGVIIGIAVAVATA